LVALRGGTDGTVCATARDGVGSAGRAGPGRQPFPSANKR